MSRISSVPLEQWSPDLRAMFGPTDPDPVERGPARITAHRPELAVALVQYGRALRANRTLSERLMELVRLRIAFHNQCRSCMAVRYASALEQGLDEGSVCSLENPYEAPDLTDADKVAIEYGERMATNHLSIDDAMYDRLRGHFTEPQIVELGIWAAHCVGMGRLAATWHLVEGLPEAFQAVGEAPIGPWSGEPVVVNRRTANAS